MQRSTPFALAHVHVLFLDLGLCPGSFWMQQCHLPTHWKSRQGWGNIADDIIIHEFDLSIGSLNHQPLACELWKRQRGGPVVC